MKIVKFILSFCVSILLFAMLSGWMKIPNNPLPPLGIFLNPYTGVWANAEKEPKRDLTLTFSTLDKPVRVIYDDRWVPHIFATSTKDALFAQGYVVASNRLFQMDFITRAASSKLSEIMGDKTVQFDLKRHTSGLEKVAEETAQAWEKTEHIGLLNSYVAGVNEYIKTLSPKDYPIEYKLLDYEVEPWSIKKTALVVKYMADVLANNCNDLESTNTLALLGKETFDLVYNEAEDGGYPVIPLEKKYSVPDINKINQNNVPVVHDVYKHSFYDGYTKGVGSNNWAISGKNTLSGNPILCNDPHLSLSLPSIWIEAQLITPAYNAYGVSFPGFPGIIIGFNEHIAWGETNVGQDVQDLFNITWTNKERTKYKVDGEVKEVTYDIREIKVKGGKTITDSVKYTIFGPIVKESVDGKHDLAKYWLPLFPSDKEDYMTFIDAMHCTSLEEYQKVTEIFDSPAQNFLVASKSGDIGLRVNGKFPVRSNEDGRYIKEGTSQRNTWQDFIPRSENPQIINPAQGYLVSANQRSAGKDYPYYYTGSFEHFRNRSINESLKGKKDITPADMMALQGDTKSYKAVDMVPLMLAAIGDAKSEIIESLKTWNYRYDANLIAPVYFEEWFNLMYINTFDEIFQYKDSIDVLYPEDFSLISLAKNHCDHKIFDDISTPEIERCQDIFRKSFQELQAKMKKENPTNWGKHRPLIINHYTRIPALSVANLEVGGSPDVINAINKNFGPSWRMIVQLGDTIEAYGVYPGGQSGNPASVHYKDMIDTWAKRQYYKLNYVKSENELIKK